MLKCLSANTSKKVASCVLSNYCDVLHQQTRNTFILKRRWNPPLYKQGAASRKLRGRHFVYDLVEDTELKKKAEMKLILTQFVDGVGGVGDIITVKPNAAYKNFLLPGLAVYATPENSEKFKPVEGKTKALEEFSSPHAKRTIDSLSRLVLQITMSKVVPWTLQPWHVRVSLRKAGFEVPEQTITMPPDQISGPDLTLQEKEFYVTITVNNKEKVNVRCRIHHWAIGPQRLPWQEFHWKLPATALFPDQVPELEQIPLPK